MKFSDNPRSSVIHFRATEEELAFLKAEADRRDTTIAGIVREALDLWLTRQASSRSSDSGSKRLPSGVTAKVKAASKRSPSSSQGTTQ